MWGHANLFTIVRSLSGDLILRRRHGDWAFFTHRWEKIEGLPWTLAAESCLSLLKDRDTLDQQITYARRGGPSSGAIGRGAPICAARAYLLYDEAGNTE